MTQPTVAVRSGGGEVSAQILGERPERIGIVVNCGRGDLLRSTTVPRQPTCEIGQTFTGAHESLFRRDRPERDARCPLQQRKRIGDRVP